MDSLFWLYVKSELRNKKGKYIKQCLYLIPIIVVTLVLSSTQNIKYYNQKEFLEGVGYTSIDTDAISGAENTVEVYDGDIAVVRDVRNVMVYDFQYSCQLFNIVRADMDFSKTYFTKENLNNFNLEDLGARELVISYDVAKRLKVDIGDKVCLISYGSDKYIEYTVKGIMKTKYKYGEIGVTGTVIVKRENSDILQEMYGEAAHYTFTEDTLGDISIEDEMRECNVLGLPVMSVLVVNVIFPVLGGILLTIIASREINSMMGKMKYSWAVLVSQGAEAKLLGRSLILIEGIVFLIAITVSMFLYKYVFLEKMIGHFISMRVFVRYYIILVAAGIAIIVLSIGNLLDKMKEINILKYLGKRGQAEE